ncbi:MAG: ATP-dependent DNA helicase RecG [Oscillospiraceae bacterium]|nr:ATP-dependent DNA helicase RecG [Oscillospiraceae bacterium]
MATLSDNIQYLKGVGEKRAALFAKMGIATIEQLLYAFPRKYTDYSQPYPLAAAPYGSDCVVRVRIYSIGGETRVRGGKSITKVMAGDESGGLVITFFNNPYAAKKLSAEGEYLLHGRFTGLPARREIINPEFISALSPAPLTPIYHLTAGLGNTYVAKCVKTALEACADQLHEPLPISWLQQYKLCSLKDAIIGVHCPASMQQVETARRRLIFDELLSLQLGLLTLRSRSHTVTGAKMEKADVEVFYKALPFKPTNAQKRAVTELIADFKSDQPMNRLLQGDVGSGKTLVAAAGMVIAAQNGFQSVLMAPTEILAEQHAATLNRLLEPFGLTVALLTGSIKASVRKPLLAAIADGRAHIVVGTHAVIGEKVQFHKLGFAVTDEQHRFGVRQRSLLAAKAQNPHLLVMSATPIPRTLGLLMFGDLDISILDELPPGRQPIKTYAVGTDKRARMFGFIEKHLAAGRQAYIVCPLIEESDADGAADMQAVTTYFEEIAKPLLPGRKIALMHGKLKAAEKMAVMDAFAKGEYDVLCSTTVIEVGVDVPNSTIMVIENAERYGLSALHQLRGRVGRGSNESFCILVSDHQGKDSTERLQFLCKTTDGFEIAKFDLEHRGPGDFFGNRQHGLPQLKVADLMADSRVLYVTQELAAQLLQEDAALQQPQHKGLRQMVQRLFNNEEISFN